MGIRQDTSQPGSAGHDGLHKKRLRLDWNGHGRTSLAFPASARVRRVNQAWSLRTALYGLAWAASDDGQLELILREGDVW